MTFPGLGMPHCTPAFAAYRLEKAVDGTHQHFSQCRQLRDLPYGLAFFDFVDGVSKNVVELLA